jgi:hypothetical protein
VWIKGKRKGAIAGTKADYGYQIVIFRKTYTARRLAWLYMTGDFPPDGQNVYSISQNPFSSRWSDLSISPSGCRSIGGEKIKEKKFSRLSRSSSLQIPGVSLHKKSGLYRATININGKQKSLGYYKTIDEAEMASISARERVAEMVRKNNP